MLKLINRTLSVLQPEALFRMPARSSGLHTSTNQLNSNRTSIACIPRQKYARLYPVLLVRPDGSTIRFRYKEPRQILMMPVDINTLPEAERRARMRRKRSHAIKTKEEVQFEDEFSLDVYRKFWEKK